MFMLGSQAYLIMQNIFEAPFWFLLPVSMVVCNDIMAYLFGKMERPLTQPFTDCFVCLFICLFVCLFVCSGFFFGRTSLIKLSPNKTWEGFIGAFISTVIFGVIVSR